MYIHRRQQIYWQVPTDLSFRKKRQKYHALLLHEKQKKIEPT